MSQLPIAIIGSGPAGLMAASVLASAGRSVQVFEKRAGMGRKILIAGSSGLNVSCERPFDDFVDQYSGPKLRWRKILTDFPPSHWLKFIESLGLETFCGTSKRYFVKDMKGSNLLKKWIEHLKALGVEFFLNQEALDFEVQDSEVKLTFNDQSRTFSAVCFCLGGGSWEKTETPVRWPKMFISKSIRWKEFQSANAGFKVNWPEEFLKEAEGAPLKSIVFHTSQGSRAGELVITNYGLEGTPIYALGESGESWIDLKPSLSAKEIYLKLQSSRENLSPMRRVKKYLHLSSPALALLFHLTPPEIKGDLEKLTHRIKRFPIQLGERQPLQEAISSSGGIGGLDWEDLDDSLMLKKFPRVFVAGEMMNWVAPTGGFLIQGCVSQGYTAGMGILKLRF